MVFLGGWVFLMSEVPLNESVNGEHDFVDEWPQRLGRIATRVLTLSACGVEGLGLRGER